MAYDDVQDTVNEAVRDFVYELVDDIVERVMEEARECETFHINHEKMIEEVDVEDIFADVLSLNEDEIDSLVMDTLYDQTIYDDDCLEIIKEYGLDSAVDDYYKGMDLSRCNDVAYHILVDNVFKSDVDIDDFYDAIYMDFAERWKEHALKCCIMSLDDAVKILSEHGFSKIVYEDESVRFHHPSSGCEFKLTKDLSLISDSVKIKLDFIRDNEYDETLEFYYKDVKIAEVDY